MYLALSGRGRQTLCLPLLSCEPSPLRRGCACSAISWKAVWSEVNRGRVVTIQHGPVVNTQGKVWMAAITLEFHMAEQKDLALLEVGRKKG